MEDPELAELPILICGHSMGGGIASILAILLRVDPRVPSQVKGKIRAVCLASAAMGDRRLTWLIRGFCVSVILDCDLVPRVDVNSVALFVQEVAKASPLKQAILSLNRWCSSIKVQEKKGSGMKPLFAPGMCLWVLPGSKLTKRSGSKPADVGIDDGDAFEVNEAGLADSPLDLDRQHGFSIQSVMSNGGLMDILMQELHVPPSFPTDDDKLSRLAGSSMRPEEGASSQAGSSSPKPSLASAPFELRLIEPHHMGKILFFQKACTDHLPTSYLTAMRLLEEQQEARIKKEKDLTRIKTTLTVAKAPELQTTNSAPHTLRRDVKSSRF